MLRMWGPFQTHSGHRPEGLRRPDTLKVRLWASAHGLGHLGQ